MAKTTKTLAEKIITATASAKTKQAIADKIGVSYTYVSGEVNALVAAGKLLKITNKSKGGMGRPAATFKRVAA
jgi:predicted ArsR family transcriptional regulator